MSGVLGQMASASTPITQAINAVMSPYPPSFDNNPALFAWALFARILIVLMAAATLVKISSRNRMEGIEANHPVYYHRMTVCCFLWGAMIGSLSDALTYLFWGEVGDAVTYFIFVAARVLDGMTMFPFLMALFVPLWLRWLCEIGVLKSAPTLTLNGVINDVRTTWDSKSIPLLLLGYSALGSAAVTVGKYWLWLEHGRP